MVLKRISTAKFQDLVWVYYRGHGRSALPWRKTRNAYKILVSEVMLQQTQVDRVIPKYREFLKAFPTLKALAEAPLVDVLRVWSGLGYNRRAMLLKRAAEAIVTEHKGAFPQDQKVLEALPGIGSYTAAAIRAFAFNEPSVCVETNIRTAFIHHFFAGKQAVHDRDIERLVEATLDRENPREWYYALMDYGAHLKKTIGNPNSASKHYARQSRFEGSRRQARGLILRTLLKGPCSERELQSILERPSFEIGDILKALSAEGYITQKRGRYSLR